MASKKDCSSWSVRTSVQIWASSGIQTSVLPAVGERQQDNTNGREEEEEEEEAWDRSGCKNEASEPQEQSSCVCE